MLLLIPSLGFNVAFFLVDRILCGMSFCRKELISKWWMVQGFLIQCNGILGGIGVWMESGILKCCDILSVFIDFLGC